MIGIVAARLVEHYGAPVALLAAEGDGRMRASVRAPKGFAVDAALQACGDLLERFGGHPAAGGFTVKAERVTALHERLNDLAQVWREREGLQLVMPEALLKLEQINRPLWRELQRLEPFGIGNPTPLFWSCGCTISQQRELRGGHLQLSLRQGEARVRAMAWRWGAVGHLLPKQVDVAYHLRLNRWNGEESLQLEVVGIRPSSGEALVLQRQERSYWVRREGNAVVIRNADGGRTPGRSRAGPAGSPSDRSPEGGTPLCQSPGPRRSQGDGTGGLETTKPPGENLQGAKRVDEAEA